MAVDLVTRASDALLSGDQTVGEPTGLSVGHRVSPQANRAQDERRAGVENRVMSTPTSAMITAAAVAPTPGI
jgi:hypothetical protein